jgi:hypothetical protein
MNLSGLRIFFITGMIFMKRKGAFISFDFDPDEDPRSFWAAQSQNPNSPFEIRDRFSAGRLHGRLFYVLQKTEL